VADKNVRPTEADTADTAVAHGVVRGFTGSLHIDIPLFLELAREAEPAVEIVKDAADFLGGAIGGGGNGADALMEEMALEADVDIFFAEAERVLEEGDDEGMGEAPGEQSDAAADGAGVGADEVGDLAEGVAAGDGEVEEVLIGRGEFVEAVEDSGIGLFWLLGARIVGAAEIEHELDFTTGHLTPLSGAFGPVTTSV